MASLLFKFILPNGEEIRIVSPTYIEDGNPQLDVKLPIVCLSGSADERGAAHGTLLCERIEKTVDFYRSKLFSQWSDTLLKSVSLEFFERIKSFSQEYAIELQAIASHAGRALWEITMLVSRTEILQSTAPNECTTLYFKNQGILGQNWDWLEDFENLVVIFDVLRQDGHRFLALGEPGFVKFGLNTSGIGVCLNILTCGTPTGGIPVHILLRKVLDSRSITEAYQAIAQAPRATMSSILIADEGGRYQNLELAGSDLFELTPSEVEVNSIVVRTNGYLTDEKAKVPAPKETASSADRIRRARTLALSSTAQNEANMLAILLDTEGSLPICRKSENRPNGLSDGTVTTVVMNLKTKTFIFSRGNPRNKEFSFVSLI
ncbi:MAG: C45 family peptidase [Scytonema sp. PMC 1069.18]|nr:C45 family peptidase [Scytonema sp. PMC 1069.18]MEC4883163.1 C45 family peptidase [Scytonema sp. PMC 1070.18]